MTRAPNRSANLAARGGGAEPRFTLLPFRVVLQLTGAFEPPGHQLLSIAALLHRLEIREAEFGHDLAPLAITTSRTAGTLRET
jgi:hypothetical protein